MPLVEQLIKTVEELLAEHETMLQIVEQKKQALIAGDITKIQEFVNQEVQFVRKVEKLEEKRMKLGKQISAAKGIPLEELTATKLASLEENPERAAKINLLTGRFVKAIGELKAANDLNGQLIQQSLELVHNSINLLADQPNPGTYSGKGDTGQVSEQRRFFDTQA